MYIDNMTSNEHGLITNKCIRSTTYKFSFKFKLAL